MPKKTFCIEGRWTGPQSPAGSFTSLCYREYTRSKTFADAVAKLGSIQFTDGTSLILRSAPHIRGMRRGAEMLSYSSLIHQCLRHNVNRVADLLAETKA